MKYIFQIKIKAGHTVEEYMDAWEKGSSIIQKSIGAKGTRLYKKIDDSNALIAIAEWSSKEERDVAMKNLKKADPDTSLILNKHKEFGEIDTLGAFEEIGQVTP